MSSQAETRWELPPLILYPFGRGAENVSPHGHSLEARYVEFRMLCLVGKYLLRWMAQCMDFAERDPALANTGIRPQSFADLLVNHTPPAVAARFRSWGVTDYPRVVARAIGIIAVFPSPPDFDVIAPGFLQEYCFYADSLFSCYQRMEPFLRLDTGSFGFSLYTSDEYLSTVG